MTKAIFPVVDAHIHLEQYDYDHCEQMLSEAQQAGVKAVVAVSMDLPSSQRTYLLHKQYGGLVVPAYGFHPEQSLPTKQQEQQLVAWIKERHVQGDNFVIGEIGLPYYCALEAKEQKRPFDQEPYIQFLDRMLSLAKHCKKPVVLHAVYEDAEIVLELLQKYEIKQAHFHWFKGPESSIAKMIEYGYFISITPDIYVEDEIQQLVRRYPLELMMVETDGPWPFEGPYLGKRTEPCMVVDVVKEIARIKALPEAKVANIIYQNSCKFYHI